MNTSQPEDYIQAYLGVHKIKASPIAHHRDTENAQRKLKSSQHRKRDDLVLT
jgi:hypothetical protein